MVSLVVSPRRTESSNSPSAFSRYLHIASPNEPSMCFGMMQNINRAIKKASEGNVGDFAESTFEAYGFGGASFVINVLSDNNNRATSDVKSCVNKRNGKIAEQGSVLFMYDRRGKLEVDARLDEETLMEAAIEAGCEDMELLEVRVLEGFYIETLGRLQRSLTNELDSTVIKGDTEGTSIVYCDPKETGLMADAVRSLGHENMKVSLVWVSKAPVEVADEEFEKNMEIIDALEELDDVDSVEHNMSN